MIQGGVKDVGEGGDETIEKLILCYLRGFDYGLTNRQTNRHL